MVDNFKNFLQHKLQIVSQLNIRTEVIYYFLNTYQTEHVIKQNILTFTSIVGHRIGIHITSLENSNVEY